MVTIVLDNTKTLDDSDIYQPLLYRSIRNEECFYIKYNDKNRINKIKSIVKYYPEKEYELIVLVDLNKTGESLLEKIYCINDNIVANVFSKVKQPIKTRYIVLDYINSNYLIEEKELLKNIDSFSDDEIESCIARINKKNPKLTWVNAIKNIDLFNLQEAIIENILPLAEVDIITLNKLPNQEKEVFNRDIYLKIYGFISLIAEGSIVEATNNCCYKDIPIYNLNIELNYEAVEETAKRYYLNLENEEKKLDLNLFEKIDQVPIFVNDDVEEQRQRTIINEINSTKVSLRKPKISLFKSHKDLRNLDKYMEGTRKEYRKQLEKMKNIYGLECRNARDDLNKDFSDLKTATRERFEVENKIKEETDRIEITKQRKTKPVIMPLDEHKRYEDFLEESKNKLTKIINDRKLLIASIKKQVIMVLVYTACLLLLILAIGGERTIIKINAISMIALVFLTWMIVTLIDFIKHRKNIKDEYKRFALGIGKMFYITTQRERAGVEGIQLTRSSILGEKKIEYLQELLDNSCERIEKNNKHKYLIKEHKSFAKLIINNAVFDGTVNIADLDSTYSLDIDRVDKRKNKTYSFLDYVMFKKYKLSFKNANTSRVIVNENAGTYISYVSIE